MRWSSWSPVTVAVVVTGLAATVGSFGVGFGVMTACTDEFSCTTASCPPCAAADGWLTGGWVLQGVLLLTVGALALTAARRVRAHAVRTAALVVAPVSLVALVGTAVAAQHSW